MIHPEAFQHLLEDLRRQEGFREEAYLDTVGVWTIGYGFTEDVRPGDTITRDEAETYLRERAMVAVSDARKLCPTFDQLDPVRQAVMANLAYNLGYRRLAKFRNTLARLAAGDYVGAANGMKNSLWCRQVKTRCTELVEEMRTGVRVR